MAIRGDSQPGAPNFFQISSLHYAKARDLERRWPGERYVETTRQGKRLTLLRYLTVDEAGSQRLELQKDLHVWLTRFPSISQLLLLDIEEPAVMSADGREIIRPNRVETYSIFDDGTVFKNDTPVPNPRFNQLHIEAVTQAHDQARLLRIMQLTQLIPVDGIDPR